MWARFLRLFITGTVAYSNPVKFAFGLLMVVAAPYLIYLFWGSLIFIVLLAILLFFTIRFVIKKMRKQRFG